MGTWKALVVLALLSACAVLAAPAQATFHEEVVNEVMLASGSGDSSDQFVELWDPASEPFPLAFGPYKLIVYDGAGNQVGTPHTLNAMAMANASSVRPYLISTAASDTESGQT